jgi:hypothetical protein
MQMNLERSLELNLSAEEALSHYSKIPTLVLWGNKETCAVCDQTGVGEFLITMDVSSGFDDIMVLDWNIGSQINDKGI